VRGLETGEKPEGGDARDPLYAAAPGKFYRRLDPVSKSHQRDTEMAEEVS
jgi:hypothetical protein